MSDSHAGLHAARWLVKGLDTRPGEDQHVTRPILNRLRATVVPLPLAVTVQWDVIDQAGHWYYQDEYEDFWLQLQREYVANDAAPPPPRAMPDLLRANGEVKGKNAKCANNCYPAENTVSMTVCPVGDVPTRPIAPVGETKIPR